VRFFIFILITAILHNIAVRENAQLPEEEVGAVGADGEEDAVSDDDGEPLNPHEKSAFKLHFKIYENRKQSF